MNASSKDSQALEQATTGAGLSGDANDARSPNPAPSAPAPGVSDTPATSDSPSTANPAASSGGASEPSASQAFPDASKPGSEPPSEAGKSDKPKVPVPTQDAQGELPSPDAVGEAG
ncbi:MAG: hypothetical protein ACRYGL_15540 [Janthinobacterium lividum]